MHLSFIGMSGVGKSYWAKQLAQAGWLHLDCDAKIAQRLGEIIEVGDDEDPVHAVGRWMGMPWDDGYEANESRYLELEQTATTKAIDQLAEHEGQPVVIDTTGSVIYTGDVVLNRLKRSTRVLYFDVPDAVRQLMVELYLIEPKPVLWQGGYQPEPGELETHALERCYTKLLADRNERYRGLADVVIDYHALREPGFGVDDLVKMIGV
ncbi:MAG: AAA family ATPase [Phycisphaeraceae bacterium]|nr:AAA family ATPase [Phycisphaeraceae bacterium]